MRAGARRQLVAIALALSLFGAARQPALWALALAYVLGLALLELTRLERLLASTSPARFVALLVVLAAPGVTLLGATLEQLVENEGLAGVLYRLEARLHAQKEPAIAPPLVVADRPQTFFVRAAQGARVEVQLGRGSRALPSEEVGAGLYRVEYEPRRDGSPEPRDGALRAVISVDGRSTERAMLSVTPLAHPRWLTASPEGQLAATVSEETDELVIVSARGLERRVAVGDGPVDCAFVDARTLAISHRHDAALWLVDAASGARVHSLALGARQGRVAVSSDGTLLAVARHAEPAELVFVDTRARAVRERLALDRAADWLAFGADASRLVVSVRGDATLRELVLGPQGFRERARVVLGRAAVTLARSRDGTRMFAATTDYRPDGSPNLGNHFVQDQIVTFALDPLRVTRVQRTARRTPRQSKPGDVDRGVSPMGMFEAADGSLLVTFAGTDELWRMSEAAPEPAVLELGEADLVAPHGVVELADGSLIVSSPAAGAIGVAAGRSAELRVLRLAPDDSYLRGHAPLALARRLGERTFYESTRSGISCQSCHMHADSDEAAHNLGTHRALPTLSVRGLAGTSPYLRDGSFARVGDLDHVAQTLYRGYLRKAPARARVLDSFVLALPRHESRSERDAERKARERRGAEIFVRAGCTGCHGGPAFTQLGQHLASGLFPSLRDVAPDDVLDAPSLLSVGATPPYLSDGRARSLDAVLGEHNRDNGHGDTARLDAQARRDLVTFLEAL